MGRDIVRALGNIALAFFCCMLVVAIGVMIGASL